MCCTFTANASSIQPSSFSARLGTAFQDQASRRARGAARAVLTLIACPAGWSDRLQSSPSRLRDVSTR
eukprot:3701267-Rhodomonas_salina.2